MEPASARSAARAAGVGPGDRVARGAQRRVSRALPVGGGDESCHCGWAGDPSGRCSADAVRRYRVRIFGPLLDRIDLHVEVPRLPPQALRANVPPGETSAAVRERVEQARQRQQRRAGRPNGPLGHGETLRDCCLQPRDEALLEQAIERLRLSAGSLHHILRVARAIGDLDASDAIATAHLTEAIAYRQLDRGEATASAVGPTPPGARRLVG